jgi:hypothetical protein
LLKTGNGATIGLTIGIIGIGYGIAGCITPFIWLGASFSAEEEDPKLGNEIGITTGI